MKGGINHQREATKMIDLSFFDIISRFRRHERKEKKEEKKRTKRKEANKENRKYVHIYKKIYISLFEHCSYLNCNVTV